ncbi:hypothetical protein Pyn_17622 [Prunus yedoensis var. nudiflora]|uniref:Uncharacterized protein n=1 Tax=Prunus yedoensis var. nudiflora TaxID=2094558 RepID=A0A314UYU0_PRUYE|nr:hypothetical protein Pyn_17622 [Prunus yedoensis var. nudiflora]
MGALTSNRKRGDECLSLNSAHPSPYSQNFQISKRPRFSYMKQSPDRPILSSNSVASRVFGEEQGVRYIPLFEQGKKVIELDEEVETDRVSEDSSIEEVLAIEEDDREGPSVVDYVQELDTKMVDCGLQGTQPSASSVVWA